MELSAEPRVGAIDTRLSALTKEELFAEIDREIPAELLNDKIVLEKVVSQKNGTGLTLFTSQGLKNEFSLWWLSFLDNSFQFLGNTVVH